MRRRHHAQADSRIPGGDRAAVGADRDAGGRQAARRQRPDRVRRATTRCVGDTVLYTINPDGSHEHQLLPVGLGSPHWSPDGSAIVADAQRTPETRRGSSIQTPGPIARCRTPTRPAFDTFACGVPSPDFERLACAGFGQTDPSLNGIYTVRTSDGGGLRRLTSDTIEDAPGDYSPDGKRLVYSARRARAARRASACTS